MPNQQGGKNYKKSKHSTEAAKIQEANLSEGQMYGRVLKVLGNLSFNVHCNDGRPRVCRVCGAMRKRVWIGTGDIVIISLREFEVSNVISNMQERIKMTEKGDIIYKFDQSLLGKAKKLNGINPNLFLNLETSESVPLNETGFFGFEGDVEEGKEGDEGEGEGNEKEKEKGKKQDDDDDFNIDDI